MNKRIIALILSLILILLNLAACVGEQKPVDNTDKTLKPQVVVATNPILVVDGEENIIAFNDIKNAMASDKSEASLTSLADDTNWSIAYKVSENWKKHGIYGIGKWRNGANIASNALNAYYFSDDGTISVMPYTTTAAELKTYQNDEPLSAGILVSVSGTEKEALCYEIKADGKISIPAGKITAIESVNGIKTGFLAEDNTSRTAAVEFIINKRVIWSGTLSNATGNNGTAVTELSYPDLTNITVKSGDKLFISIKLDAVANKVEDITTTQPDDDDDDDDNNATEEPETVTDIKLMDGFDSRYRIIRSKDATITQQQIISVMAETMSNLFEADVRNFNDEEEVKEYEILVGRTNREESKKVYDDLTNYRANNASDFIIRVVNNKIVIAANTDYTMGVAYNNNAIDKYESRPVFTGAGKGKITITYASVQYIPAAKVADYAAVTYVDGEATTAEFVAKDAAPKTPADKADLEFKGWFDNEALEGTAVTAITADTTLYAKWEAAQTAVLGDMNNDEKVNILDLLLIKIAAANNSTDAKLDIDNNGTLADAADIAALRQIILNA